MLARIVLSGLLVWALLGAGAAGVAAAAKAGSGALLEGRTEQGYPIKIRLIGERKIRLVHFKADLQCRDGTLLELTESGFLPTPLRNGRFRETQYGRTDTVRFRGRVVRGRVTGAVKLTDRLGKKRIFCRSAWIDFRAS